MKLSRSGDVRAYVRRVLLNKVRNITDQKDKGHDNGQIIANHQSGARGGGGRAWGQKREADRQADT